MNEFKPERPTLVFVHGLSGSSSAWAPYEKKFENNCNILTFDLRGHGKSAKPKNLSDYEIKKFADDLYELVSFLHWENFILISHSFGVLVALEFLTEHQALVKAAVFLSPGFAPGKRLIERAAKPFIGGACFLLPFLPFSGKGRGHVDYSHYKNTGDWNIRRMIADIGMTSLRVYLFASKKSYEFNRADLLDKITIPVLIMHGKKDTIFPCQNSLIMSEKIKKSKLILLDNTDHIVVLNNFKEVSEAMEKFIENL